MSLPEVSGHDVHEPGAAPRTLSGLIERVVFHNAETGFVVLRVKLTDQREPVTIVGEASRAAPGEVVRAEGAWQTSPSFGLQFRACRLAVMPPGTRDGIEAYLASGAIKGIGRSLAKKLVAAFGERVFEVIERQPERLREVPGIGRGLAQRVIAAWAEQRTVRDIMLFLHSHGLSPLRATRIFEAYGRNAIQAVTSNPYRLADDIRGVGFASADELAQRLAIPRDSPLRLRAGLAHVLGEAQAQGHCALPRAQLLEAAAQLLEADQPALEAALQDELEAGSLVESTVESETCVFLPALHRAEHEIAETLAGLARGRPGWKVADAQAARSASEAELGLELAAGQRRALELALTSKLLIITGGPGTGKTTLVRAILKALEGSGAEVLLAAPTGRAARRLTESTGRDACTLHRLLEAEPGRGFRRGPARPLACDLLIVDEASMIDIFLAQGLLAAMPREAALFLIGDVDQLPSVGPGQVLADLIASGRLPVVRLDEIFRQAAKSRIVRNAHRVNQGLMPELARSGEGLCDFYAIKAKDPEHGSRLVVELVTERIAPSFAMDPIGDIQVLCPTNRGALGARHLNGVLQRALNPTPLASIERAGMTYAQGDKVMQLENDYEREVYNGDIGRIVGVDREQNQLFVEMDGRMLTYGQAELDRLVPAYAITVHKAQGSEYPAVVLPLVKQHGRMLRRNLVYTAITRARRLVVLVTQADALELAIARRPEPRRWSNLRALIVAQRDAAKEDIPDERA